MRQTIWLYPKRTLRDRPFGSTLRCLRTCTHEHYETDHLASTHEHYETDHLASTQILFRHGRKPVCRCQAQPGPLPAGVDPSFTRGGYVTDLHTPVGHLISDDFLPDHLHHHGVLSQ